MRQVVVIVNPVAGGGSGRRRVEQLVRRLRGCGQAVEVCVTGGPGAATALARERAQGEAVVIAAGGDGTVREVLAGLAGSRAIGAIYPTGTENLVGGYFGYAARVGDVVATLRAGVVRQVDMGLVNGRPFFLVVGVGFDAEVVREVHRRRGGHVSRADYFWPTVRTLGAYRFPRLEVIVDGSVVFEGRGLVFLGKVPRYAGGLRVVPHARPDDGQVAVAVYPAGGRLALCRRAAGVVLRTLSAWWEGGEVEPGSGGGLFARGRVVEVRSEAEAGWEQDGDPGGWLPLRATVQPGAVRLLVPPRARGG